MADPVGLAASVLTLGGFLITLLQFASEVKDSSEDLRRYYIVLESIKRASWQDLEPKNGCLLSHV